MYTYIPSPWDLPPISPQSHPSRSSQSTELSFLSFIPDSYLLIIFSLRPYDQPCSSAHGCLDTHSLSANKLPKDEKCIYVNPNLPSRPTTPFPTMTTHLFSICISILASQIGLLYRFSCFPIHPLILNALSAFPLCGHPGSSPVVSLSWPFQVPAYFTGIFLAFAGKDRHHPPSCTRISLPHAFWSLTSWNNILKVPYGHIFLLIYFFSELQIIRIYCPSYLQALISIVVLLHECACVSPQEVGEGQICLLAWPAPSGILGGAGSSGPGITQSSKALQFLVFIHCRLH